ncbi:hypothetical protein Sjap_014611 [Stephania japonica]|uniref:Chloroplast lumen common family protein n=1 Tax=Stephania japonica TaxID=461633 RepID=A0AAP0IHK5_9MAGN
MDSLSRGAQIFKGAAFITPDPKLVRSSHSSRLIFSASSRSRASARASISSSLTPEIERSNGLIRRIQGAGKVLILTAAAMMVGKLSQFPARAEVPVAIVDEEKSEKSEEVEEEPQLSEFLNSRHETVDELKGVVIKKLEDGEDEEALKILRGLVSALPAEVQWRVLMGRLLSEMGEKGEARKVFEEVLSRNPLCFEVLFLNSLLMDQIGEGQAALQQLHDALELAEKSGNSVIEKNNVRLIMAQIYYLQKNFDEALKCYQEVSREDPKDFRAYFYQGIIYHKLDRKEEANEQFAKCREASPEKFDIEVFLQSTLSRMKIYGTDN